MNEQLSILELVSNATIIVQLVMVLLVLASVVSWILVFQKAFLLASVRRMATAFEDDFWSGEDLRALYVELDEGETEVIGLESIFHAGFKEYTRSSQLYGTQAERIMQNVQRAMRVAMAREEERLEAALPFLATVGSTSPYIGLFGTVWGIMNSFRGLAMVNQATLSVVAPGISEALIATAIGLFAAIPAVIAYNRFSAQVEVIMNRFDTFSEEFSAILNRSIKED
ncbi:MAG: protein TolQ [Gammaproteobacteria bacterium]|jgi:biopolymer transport protein TolQ|nr:protein TolQ [Gammaproteobacteria bacterium]|tara:strand:- start:348 stop:1025 length:678 start_codon:yes stop_codon:yes gene_type:complete